MSKPAPTVEKLRVKLLGYAAGPDGIIEPGGETVLDAPEARRLAGLGQARILGPYVEPPTTPGPLPATEFYAGNPFGEDWRSKSKGIAPTYWAKRRDRAAYKARHRANDATLTLRGHIKGDVEGGFIELWFPRKSLKEPPEQVPDYAISEVIEGLWFHDGIRRNAVLLFGNWERILIFSGDKCSKKSENDDEPSNLAELIISEMETRKKTPGSFKRYSKEMRKTAKEIKKDRPRNTEKSIYETLRKWNNGEL